MAMDSSSGSAPPAAVHQLDLTAAEGPWGGPAYRYSGAEIRCLRGGNVCGLVMAEHPFDGSSFGVPGTITPLIDLWLDEKRLPAHVKAVPRSL